MPYLLKQPFWKNRLKYKEIFINSFEHNNITLYSTMFHDKLTILIKDIVIYKNTPILEFPRLCTLSNTKLH